MKQVIAALFAAGILALSLTACGGTMTQEPESAVTASRTHTFHADGCTLDVTVDLRGGWAAAFEQDSAVQKPEKLFHEKGLMLYLLVFIGLFILLMTIDIPGLAILTDSKILSIPGGS